MKIIALQLFALFLVLDSPILGFSQDLKETDATSILGIMDRQEAAWNRGDIDEFMIGYWNSDSLLFIGSKGLTRGWNKTLENYHQGYPDREAMGVLEFGILKTVALGKKHALVIGTWKLTRAKDTIGGCFSLTWQKTKEGWVIIADHSS